jgi:hypothetical protein
MAKVKTEKKEKTIIRKQQQDKISMTVYDVTPLTDGVTEIKLPKNLHTTLDLTNTVKERLMPLSSEEGDKDSDFIANFNFQGGFLFGAFVRLNAGERSAVLIEQLDRKTIDINEMVKEADEKTAGSLNPPVFFCISGDLLVLSRARSNVRALEVYINWFFREHELENNQVRFIPKKNTANTIPLRDIKSIQLAENFFTYRGGNSTEIVKIDGIKENALKLLVDDVNKTADYAWGDVLSATLTLKLRKKDLKNENSAVLDTALRIADSDEIIIKSKDNKTIKGTQYLIRAVRSIDKTSSGYYNEKQIENEMRAILKAVKNGQVVS